MADWTKQRYYEDVTEGEDVPTLAFPMTIQRFVMEAGANRDFNAWHHNDFVAKASNAPAIFANTTYIQGMLERTIREWIGLRGDIKKVGPMRIRIFNTMGETVLFKGKVTKKYQEGGNNLVELEMWSEHSGGVSFGPGPVLVTLPSKGS